MTKIRMTEGQNVNINNLKNITMKKDRLPVRNDFPNFVLEDFKIKSSEHLSDLLNKIRKMFEIGVDVWGKTNRNINDEKAKIFVENLNVLRYYEALMALYFQTTDNGLIEYMEHGRDWDMILEGVEDIRKDREEFRNDENMQWAFENSIKLSELDKINIRDINFHYNSFDEISIITQNSKVKDLGLLHFDLLTKSQKARNKTKKRIIAKERFNTVYQFWFLEYSGKYNEEGGFDSGIDYGMLEVSIDIPCVNSKSKFYFNLKDQENDNIEGIRYIDENRICQDRLIRTTENDIVMDLDDEDIKYTEENNKLYITPRKAIQFISKESDEPIEIEIDCIIHYESVNENQVQITTDEYVEIFEMKISELEMYMKMK